MTAVLHVGFNNFVTSENVIALIDYSSAAAKKIVRSVKAEKPRNCMDVTRGRKSQTLIVLTGDRYIISAIYRQQLAKRLCGKEVEKEETLTLPKGSKALKGAKPTINAKDAGNEEKGA